MIAIEERSAVDAGTARSVYRAVGKHWRIDRFGQEKSPGGGSFAGLLPGDFLRSGSIYRFQEIIFFCACLMAMRTFAGEVLQRNGHGVSAIRTHTVLRVLELLNTGKNHHGTNNKADNTDGQQDYTE